MRPYAGMASLVDAGAEGKHTWEEAALSNLL